MTDSRHYKFERRTSSTEFSRTLIERVDAYFRGRRVAKQANLEMVSKTLLGFAMWIGTYLWLISGRLSSFGVVGLYLLQGLAQLFVAFNIAHDANHGAYSKSRRVNKLLGYTFDMVGVSSYMWRLFHNDSHHAFINVRGADTTLISGSIFRFSRYDEIKPYHRYQHLYAPLIYCLPTLDWVLVKDYRWLLSVSRYGNRKVTKHPRGELAVLFAAKAFYYTYMLVLPLLLLKTPWFYVIVGFVLMHFLLGFSISLIFQPNHFTEGSTYHQADENGYIADDYITHILNNTADYARNNPVASCVLGGLNLHIAHHMFPRICHVHYPALTRILIATANEHGLSYRESRTIARAFAAHLRWLKALGNSDITASEQDRKPSRVDTLVVD